MTQKETKDFIQMYNALKKINKYYMAPSQIRNSCKKAFGLDFEETIEMAYENIQQEAASGIKNVRLPKTKQQALQQLNKE